MGGVWAGGVVVVLGPTGRNVAAGMTGGLAYVLEETNGALDARINKEIVQVTLLPPPRQLTRLSGLFGYRLFFSCRVRTRFFDNKSCRTRILLLVMPCLALCHV